VGTVTIEARDGGVSTYQAQDVEGWSFVHDIFPVPERVIEEPEGIVREYAVEQSYEDIGVLGKSHDYNGIGGWRRCETSRSHSTNSTSDDRTR